jgi:hypothetical protein
MADPHGASTAVTGRSQRTARPVRRNMANLYEVLTSFLSSDTGRMTWEHDVFEGRRRASHRALISARLTSWGRASTGSPPSDKAVWWHR